MNDYRNIEGRIFKSQSGDVSFFKDHREGILPAREFLLQDLKHLPRDIYAGDVIASFRQRNTDTAGANTRLKEFFVFGRRILFNNQVKDGVEISFINDACFIINRSHGVEGERVHAGIILKMIDKGKGILKY